MKSKSKKASSKQIKEESFYEKYKRYIPTAIVLVLVIGILIYLSALRVDNVAGEAVKVAQNAAVVKQINNVNADDLSVVIIPKDSYTVLDDGSIKINEQELNKVCVCSGCGYDCSCSQGCEAGCPACK